MRNKLAIAALLLAMIVVAVLLLRTRDSAPVPVPVPVPESAIEGRANEQRDQAQRNQPSLEQARALRARLEASAKANANANANAKKELGAADDPNAPAANEDNDPRSEEQKALDAKIYDPTGPGIQAAVRAHIPELKECYESWLAMNPNLGGKTKFSFAIVAGALDGGPPVADGEASITEVKLESTTVNHVFMEGCIARVFEDLRFHAPPEGRMAVTYPLTFSSDTDAGSAP